MGHPLKLVFLDTDPALGSSAARGRDIDTAAFQSFGVVSSFESTTPEELMARAKDATILITNKVKLGPTEFALLPNLKLVCVLATGTDVVNLAAAEGRGIAVCNVPRYSTASTAQHAIALLLELTNHVGEHAEHVRTGGWLRSTAFSYWKRPLLELDGLTLGVAGFGAIGARVATIGEALGMRVLVHTRTPQAQDARFVSKQDLLEQADVISLHLPLTEATRHYIDAAALRSMKRGALLVNVARGALIDPSAVAQALEQGHLGGAAVDVLESEPPKAEHPLLRAPGAIVTPHLAWTSSAARTRLLQVTYDNVAAFLGGAPQNVVRPS